MPYYCTVPRCTSMAGKAKDVSFHQFPRNEELARLWNKILKRGKPYTKYSKVCSLHFRPEDYTLNKTRGQWRTLRKDAIPSQNLPTFENPGPSNVKSTNGCWVPPPLPANFVNSQIQQQMAQAIYMQTMLAMQAAANGTQLFDSQPEQNELSISPPKNLSEIENAILLQKHSPNNSVGLQENHNCLQQNIQTISENKSYKCEECLKCFKDPDVFVLHRRMHNKDEKLEKIDCSLEKENLNSNNETNKETLKANPILANLLNSSMAMHDAPTQGFNIFDVNNILSIENQIMTALAANMEGYIRLSKMLLASKENQDCISSDTSNNENIDDENLEENKELSDDLNANNHFITRELKNEFEIDDVDYQNHEKVCKDDQKIHKCHKHEQPELNDALYNAQICENSNEITDNKDQICRINDHNAENKNQICRIYDQNTENKDQICGINDCTADKKNQICRINAHTIENKDQICRINDDNTENKDQICRINDHTIENKDQIHQKDDPVTQIGLKIAQGSGKQESNCDNQDLNESKDSNILVIDEDA